MRTSAFEKPSLSTKCPQNAHIVHTPPPDVFYGQLLTCRMIWLTQSIQSSRSDEMVWLLEKLP